MDAQIERNLGEQPIARIMEAHGLKARDLVDGAPQPITFKMVARACKGRRLSPHVKAKVRDALNRAAGKAYAAEDLFTY